MAAPMRVVLQRYFLKSAIIPRYTSRRSHTSHRNAANAVASTQEHSGVESNRERWQLVSAVCLERLPVITAELNELEQRFADLLSTIEVENSKLSSHELRHLEDLRIAQQRKREDHDETEEELMRQTAMDAEDAWEAELRNYQPADRITEADRQNDQTSLERKLDNRLVLLVKQLLGNKSHWCLPQIAHQEGESMRQSAERALTTLCGPKLQTRVLGNAPCGFYKYRLPPDVGSEQGYVGAKVFFFKAHLTGGQVEVSDPGVTEYKWLTLEELTQQLENKEYKRELRKFIQPL